MGDFSEISYPILFSVSNDIDTYKILFLCLRWDNDKGAENICKQLGYVLGKRYAAPGGTGPIQTGNRLCAGGEATVFDCPIQGGREELQYCNGHEDDQGAICSHDRKKQKDIRFCYFFQILISDFILDDGEVPALIMSNPEGLNHGGVLYTYPITYTSDLPEVTLSSFNPRLEDVLSGQVCWTDYLHTPHDSGI